MQDIFGPRTEKIALGLTLGFATALIILVGVRWHAYHWDFHMFYGSAREFAAGSSPYHGVGLSYYHPPLMLYIYRVFTLLPLAVAIEVWYTLKLAALAGLFVLWGRQFIDLQLRSSTVAFFILAYGGAIYCDLVSGNISIFEQLLLWTGFAQFLRGRYLSFSICVLLAAQAKITPVIFAGLLIALPDSRQWRAFCSTVAGFVALFSLNYFMEPELFSRFLAVLPNLDERGVSCPSFLALARDALELAFGKGAARISVVDEVAFLGVAGAIALISLLTWLRYCKNNPHIDRHLLIYFACIVYALISPRIKVYSYIILLVPTLYILRVGNWRGHVPLAVAIIGLLVVFPHQNHILPVRTAFNLFNDYIMQFAALTVWIAYLVHFRAAWCVLRPEKPVEA